MNKILKFSIPLFVVCVGILLFRNISQDQSKIQSFDFSEPKTCISYTPDQSIEEPYFNKPHKFSDLLTWQSMEDIYKDDWNDYRVLEPPIPDSLFQKFYHLFVSDKHRLSFEVKNFYYHTHITLLDESSQAIHNQFMGKKRITKWAIPYFVPLSYYFDILRPTPPEWTQYIATLQESLKNQHYIVIGWNNEFVVVLGTKDKTIACEFVKKHKDSFSNPSS